MLNMVSMQELQRYGLQERIINREYIDALKFGLLEREFFDGPIETGGQKRKTNKRTKFNKYSRYGSGSDGFYQITGQIIHVNGGYYM